MAHDRRLAISSLLVADSPTGPEPVPGPSSPPKATTPPPEVSLQPPSPTENEPDELGASQFPLYSAPPVRAAAKRGRAFAFAPTVTSTSRKKSSQSKDSDPSTSTSPPARKKPTAASRARPRGKGTSTSDRKASSTKKSLLVQAQENRARILQAQAAQEKAATADAAPKDEEREYCVCRSRYDEERAMIGCDRCDEWYHPLCVDLKDTDVDQIDLYVCPACRKQNPHLQITRKILCKRRGCEKVSRRQASKYCSDECGILAMKMLIEEKGIDRNALWKAVKDVQKPEGKSIPSESETISQREAFAARQRHEIAIFQTRLEKIAEERKLLLTLFEPSRLRNTLTEKAAARVEISRMEGSDICGWDVRLLWSDEDWLSSSENPATWEGYDGNPITEGNIWWCPEDSECERHEGWQSLLRQDYDKEMEVHDQAIGRLAERERNMRLHIDAVTNPKAKSRLMESLAEADRELARQEESAMRQYNAKGQKSRASNSKSKKKG